jgi:rod shape-determining protein MreC
VPEIRSGLRIALLAIVLGGIATAMMIVDRRETGASDPPWWSAWLLDVAVPIQETISVPLDVAHDAWVDYVALVGVRQENEELRARIAKLEEESLQLREALLASGRLGSIAEMRAAYEVPMLPAELAGYDVSPWFRAVLLDRGSSRGVLSGMPVISERGLVGLVRATSARAAKAMLILDRQSAIDGAVERSRTRGIVRGDGGSKLVFEFVARETDVAVGDVVLSSGLDGVYPKGLRIGRVVEVPDAKGGLMARALLEPAVDFDRLEQVFVLQRRGPGLELLYGSDEGDTEIAVADTRAEQP